jgi:hypothetical protein
MLFSRKFSSLCFDGPAGKEPILVYGPGGAVKCAKHRFIVALAICIAISQEANFTSRKQGPDPSQLLKRLSENL